MQANETMRKIEELMQPSLNSAQMKRLVKVLEYCFFEESFDELDGAGVDNQTLLERFIASKKLEGCSDRSMKYYRSILVPFLSKVAGDVRSTTTDAIRSYLIEYRENSKAGQTTLDNIRRVISSFFAWLENEDYILKSPARRIKKIKCPEVVKNVYTEDEIETLRDGCSTMRDLAIIDLLKSSGIRVGELVGLNISSIDLNNRECRVVGKGNKERVAYFDSRTKIHIEAYLASRDDADEALFVSLKAPHARLQASGVETLLRKLGRKLGVVRVHPHKFRRTLATRAIDKGMPIEQVQVLLGHKKIDTTMHYALVEQSNVKASHSRYIA